MFNEIGQPRWNSELIRTFGMKIGGAAAPTLAPEVAPSFDINQQDDPSLPFLRNERLCAHAGSAVAASVGNFSRVLLRNPASSGVLAVLRRVLFNSAGGGFMVLASTTVDDATVNASNVRDGRWLLIGFGSPTCIVSTGNASPVEPNTGNGKLYVLPANITEYVDTPVVIAPGQGIYMYPGGTNIAITLRGLEWTERPITAEELATG